MADEDPPPVVGRVETLERLKLEVGVYSKTVERHDEAIEKWLRPLATELPAQLAHLGIVIAGLAATAQAAASSMDQLRGALGDQAVRLDLVEERSARHEVRLAAIDEQELDARLRTVEQHAAGDARELALTRKQKTTVGVLATIGGGIVAAVSKLLGG